MAGPRLPSKGIQSIASLTIPTRGNDFLLVLGFKRAARPEQCKNRSTRMDSSPLANAFREGGFYRAIISLRIHRRAIVKSATQLSNYRGQLRPWNSIGRIKRPGKARGTQSSVGTLRSTPTGNSISAGQRQGRGRWWKRKRARRALGGETRDWRFEGSGGSRRRNYFAARGNYRKSTGFAVESHG